MYNGWLLSDRDRTSLLTRFEPRFPDIIAHHTTRSMGGDSIPDMVVAKIVGYAVDPAGIECLVVELDGSTTRPDDKTFHITWSIDRAAGFKPMHSNKLLVGGFDSIDPIPVNMRPFRTNAAGDYLFT